MGISNRMGSRRGHDPWMETERQGARRPRRLKAAVDFGILLAAIVTLAAVFGSRPIVGF